MNGAEKSDKAEGTLDSATESGVRGVVRTEAKCSGVRGGRTVSLDSSTRKFCYKGELRNGGVVRGRNGVKGRLKSSIHISRTCLYTDGMIHKGDW